MSNLPLQLWRDDAGQDIAEYAVMLAVILVIVVGTVRLVGSNTNNVFSSVAGTDQSKNKAVQSSICFRAARCTGFRVIWS